MEQEHALLADRLVRFGECTDGAQVWQALGIANPLAVPELDARGVRALQTHDSDVPA